MSACRAKLLRPLHQRQWSGCHVSCALQTPRSSLSQQCAEADPFTGIVIRVRTHAKATAIFHSQVLRPPLCTFGCPGDIGRVCTVSDTAAHASLIPMLKAVKTNHSEPALPIPGQGLAAADAHTVDAWRRFVVFAAWEGRLARGGRWRAASASDAQQHGQGHAANDSRPCAAGARQCQRMMRLSPHRFSQGLRLLDA